MRRADHPSDDPGSARQPNQYGSTRHPSSGPGAASQPRRTGTGERQAPRRRDDGRPPEHHPLVPGEIIYSLDPVVINAGMDVVTLLVTNTADRPIQVGSHYHFAEVNPGLEFDRKAAWGRRLNVLSGGSMRFEPGAVEEVPLIPIAGQRIVAGLRGECGGSLDA
jgi:urease subunit beta